jgi:hypothetical protein
MIAQLKMSYHWLLPRPQMWKRLQCPLNVLHTTCEENGRETECKAAIPDETVNSVFSTGLAHIPPPISLFKQVNAGLRCMGPSSMLHRL